MQSPPNEEEDIRTLRQRAARAIWGAERSSARSRLKAREPSGDMVIAGLGVTLGLICALFPWYVFFNQEQFGIRPMQFSGEGPLTPPSRVAYQPELVGTPITAAEAPMLELDMMPTGTLPDEDELSTGSIPLEDQPFPGMASEFRLIHVAAGRAMIEDGDGLWMVQPGSRLPDDSRVATIEERDGNWVIVTSTDRVIAIGE